jgi:hypothetical protein
LTFARQEEIEDLFDGKLAAAPLDQMSEVLAREQLLHDERRAVVLLADVENVDDVRVADEVGRTGLAHEPLHDGAVLGVLRPEHLDRDGAADVLVHRAIDVAHAAAPEELLEAILRGEHIPYGGHDLGS